MRVNMNFSPTCPIVASNFKLVCKQQRKFSSMENEYFKGKKALVTGAGAGTQWKQTAAIFTKCKQTADKKYFHEGIGRSLCLKLYQLNVEVFALSRTKTNLDSLLNECPGIHVILQDISGMYCKQTAVFLTAKYIISN